VGLYPAVAYDFICNVGNADDKSPTRNDPKELQNSLYSIKTISPIFSHLVMFELPQGFSPVFEDTKGTHYML